MLVGGVLSGQSLIRAAELRSDSTDVIRYKTAVATFRDKYFQLPGDMNNAVRFWGAQAGATTDGIDATCAALTTAATSAATCNGDGDGSIGSAGAFYEMYRFWQHLANAGLVEGSYSGIPGSGSTFEAVVGTNVPKMRIGNNVGIGALWGGPNEWGTVVGNQFLIGGNLPTSYNYTQFLKPEEAWNIDTKMDDSKPGTGTIRTKNNSWSPNCTTTDVASTSVYMLSGTSIACLLITDVQ